MDDKDLELSSEGHVSTSNGGSQMVRKRINIKLKPSVAPKEKKQKSSKLQTSGDKQSAENLAKAMQLTTLQTGLTVEPLHKSQKLRWNHKVNLLGEKITDPLLHVCEDCILPILIYGRLIPCKHVFCFKCANKTEKICQRCNCKVARVEQCALGSVFVCTIGGTKHGKSGCHRTYLSDRDLQSHIQHRHQQKVVPAEHQEVPMGVHMAPGGINLHGATYVTPQTAAVQQQISYGTLVVLQPQSIPGAPQQMLVSAPPAGHHMIPQHMQGPPGHMQGHLQMPQGLMPTQQVSQGHIIPQQGHMQTVQRHIQSPQGPQGHLQTSQGHMHAQQGSQMHMQTSQGHMQQTQQGIQGHLQPQQQGHLQLAQGHMQPPQGAQGHMIAQPNPQGMLQGPQSHQQPSQGHQQALQGHMQPAPGHVVSGGQVMQLQPTQRPQMMQQDTREPFRPMQVLMQRPSNLITVPIHEEKDFPRPHYQHEPNMFPPTYPPARQQVPNQAPQFQGQQFAPQTQVMQQRPMGPSSQRNFAPRGVFEEAGGMFGQARGQQPGWPQQGPPRNIIVQQSPQIRQPMNFFRP